MLACRPMVSLALAAMAGAAARRVYPDLGACLPYGIVLLLLLAVLFIRTPVRIKPVAISMPEGYAPHIMPTPGFFAARGVNRFILIVCYGAFLLAAWRQGAWERALDPAVLPEEKNVIVSMTACRPTYQYPGKTGRWQIPVLVTAVDGEPCRPVRVLLSGANGPAFSRGDELTAKVRRAAARPKQYPGAFDSALWLERDGIGAAVWTTREGVTVVPARSLPVATMAGRVLDDIRGRAIANTLRYGESEGPALAAMLYGYREMLPEEVRDAFRRVGIGHVLAISGLHVGLIVGLLWWLTGWGDWSGRQRAIFCLVFAFVYLGLSGGQVAAQRATLMAGIYLAGFIWGRRGDMLNSLGAAAFIITLATPCAPFDVSFQLSFIAVVFIHMALYVPRNADRPRLRGAEYGGSWRRRFGKELSSLVWLSVATWFGLFPVIAAVFNQVNLIGLPINLIVIPLMSFVLQGGILLPWVGWIPGAAWVVTLPSRCLAWLAMGADSLPYSSFAAHAPSFAWVAVFYVMAFCWMCRGMIKIYMRQRVYSRVVLGMLAVSFVGVATTMGSEPPPGGGRLAVLSGRGMPVVVAESGNGAIALIGGVSRTGLAEAGWLHTLRRDGVVSAVLVGGEAALPLSFSYHFPVGEETRVPLVADFSDADRGWRPVAGAEGVEFAVSRDGRGGLVWLAVRVGGRSVVVGRRLAERQFGWRREHGTPGHDADLFVFGLTDRPKGALESGAGVVALTGPMLDTYPLGWVNRWRWGALTVTDAVRGFDGTGWALVGE